MKSKTLFEKVWEQHIVADEPDSPVVLYIDLHLIHEVTSPQAFQGLRYRKLKVHAPEKTIATMDHIVPTINQTLPIKDKLTAQLVKELENNCVENGISFYGIGHRNSGIVHIMGPELGLTQPGMTIACGDTHASTQGAFGALAFGIGMSEVEQVLATQCLLQRRPGTFRVQLDGSLSKGVEAKDIILALLAKIGGDGGTEHVFEFTGSAIKALTMDERMTVCNMSVEGGARAGMIAPDDVTFEYLAGKPFAPKGRDWEKALQKWTQLRTDEEAVFNKQTTLNINELEPMITYGTSPSMGLPISGIIPDPEKESDASKKHAMAKALEYMGLKPGQPILGQKIDVVFIGSCANGRLSDMRAAARILNGRKVHPNVSLLIVPGSRAVKNAAEQEGLDKIFLQAGAEWREPGCSMCIALNGDQIGKGQYCVSTSNRNFEGRQGIGGRTFLAGPMTAAASAIAGAVSDVRGLL